MNTKSEINIFKDKFHTLVHANKIPMTQEFMEKVVESVGVNDTAHNLFHVYGVCVRTLEICNTLKVSRRDTELSFMGSFLHDIGCRYDRKNHHIIGRSIAEEMLKSELTGLYTEEEIGIIGLAVLEHRSSGKYCPESLVSQIVSVADSGMPNIQHYIKRAVVFRIDNGETCVNKLISEVIEHLHEKFGGTGYHWDSYPPIGYNLFHSEIGLFKGWLEEDKSSELRDQVMQIYQETTNK